MSKSVLAKKDALFFDVNVAIIIYILKVCTRTKHFKRALIFQVSELQCESPTTAGN